MMRPVFELILLTLLSPLVLGAADHRPETWFHLIGGNVSKAGLTADLEAIAGAGYGGIQFFHGEIRGGSPWDGVDRQIPCMSAEWDGMVRHIADECARLGLSFKMQNCPGWSMSGGPWIKPSQAQRQLVFVRRDVADARVPEIPLPETKADADSDWQDVACLAFPTPTDDTDETLEPMRVEKCRETNGLVRVITFARPETVRTVELPSPREICRAWTYLPDVRVRLEAYVDDVFVPVRDFAYPQGCWQDEIPLSLACGETTASVWRLTLTSSHDVSLPFVRFSRAARLDNWEGKSGRVLRGWLNGAAPAFRPAAYLAAGAVREVKVGDPLPPGRWTVLRLGHVNMKRVNAPAPAAATGWECDKLDPQGIEANFAGYVGRLSKGVLSGGRLKGMVVDSWECERPNWTGRMEAYFRAANGYDVRLWLPALFGWIVGDVSATERFLLDWRRTVGDLVTQNYYRRMSELAHAAGLEVAYETSFGDVLPGDLLEFWKYCDTPMCEFWQPYDPNGSRGHPSYKPVRPCVSAAHIYGKNRVAAEAFTSCALTWDESLRELKEQAVRHYAAGVTHLVTHTYTHNPQTDGRVPGTSFGCFIGTPFLRGQTWWHLMPTFTKWVTDCGTFLERGRPVVDVLRYLGDDVGHKPPELEPVAGYKSDYVNRDVLQNRLRVKDGWFVLPDGLRYARLWVPDGTFLLPETERRLAELARAGGKVVRGTAAEAVHMLPPQVETADASGGLLWYHRVDGPADLYFLAAETNGFRGTVALRTQDGMRRLRLDLGPTETKLLTLTAVSPDWQDLSNGRVLSRAPLERWTVSFPAGWDAPAQLALKRLVPWKDLPDVSAAGRSFSGTAVYRTTFAATGKDNLRLSLGTVRDGVRVFVNGREAAVLWAEPFVCDLTPFVRPGANELRLEVTSTWFNRLAYDFGRPPAERKTWTVWQMRTLTPPCLKPGAALRDSGLLGPVILEVVASRIVGS